jgi:alpha-methylacyl-CoA racemase
VLSWSEARAHAHSSARSAYVNIAGVEQPAPAPRFSRSTPGVRRPPPERGQGGAEALKDWGFGETEITRLRSLGLNYSA